MSPSSTFRALHQTSGVLVLPNAWDAVSARLIETCGAQAIATTSAAMSWAQGLADGERLDTHALLTVVRQMKRAVAAPLSVDLESGYSADPERLAELIAAFRDAGAAGINLEDGVGPPELLAAKIAVAKRVGGDLFVNARTDVYLRQLASGGAAIEESLRRAHLYREAGADGLFVPGLVDPDAIRVVAREARLPLNLLARPALAPVSELRDWGVRRLSVGCSLAQAALGAARRAARELLEQGTYGALFAGDPPPVAELNGWFR